MKKSIATISVLIYFAFTCGVMINMHYCMNRFDSLKFYAVESDYCGKCGMHTKDHGCCHDEVTIVKIDDDHNTSTAGFELPTLPEVPVIHSAFILAELFNSTDQRYHLNHSPPLLTEQDTYLQNCVFRI